MRVRVYLINELSRYQTTCREREGDREEGEREREEGR